MNTDLNIRSERARPAGPSRSLKWHSASSCCSDHSQRRIPPECQCARSARGARPSVAIRLCKECKVVGTFFEECGKGNLLIEIILFSSFFSFVRERFKSTRMYFL